LNGSLQIFPIKENMSAIDFCNLFKNKNNYPKYILGRNEIAIELSKNLEITGFIDDFSNDAVFMNKPVFKTSHISKDSLVLSSTSLRPITVRNNLKSLGLKHLDYFNFYKYSDLGLKDDFLCKCKIDINDNFGRYKEVYNLLNDKLSKDIFSDIINFRLSYDLDYLENFKYDIINQYFEDFIKFSKNEVFADIGGYDGATTLEFIKRCPEYKAVYLFEPEPSNIERSKMNLKEFSSIFFIQKGLSAENGKLRLVSGMGSSSRISENGDVEIDIGTLDETVKEKISFIKMDIEGEEIGALTGSEKHIRSDYPKLAISCYHKPDDFWRIPEKILGFRADYNIYLRHYTEGLHETVMFFIPK